MSLWSQENARLILDRLCEHPSMTAAGKLIGTNSKILWVWARDSARQKANGVTDSKYIITGWPDSDDSGPIWWHEAIDLARKIHALNLDHETREMLGGIERPVIEGGKFQYVIDPLMVARFKDAEEALICAGETDWPYVHDDRGARVVLTVREQPPAQLKILALRALLGGIYNIPERRETDVRSQSSVLVLHGDVQQSRRESSPLVQDLEARLRELRERKANERPALPPRIEIGKPEHEPTPEVDRQAAQRPQLDLRDHPRAYIAEPITEPVRHDPPSYARPNNGLNAENRRGNPPPGGFSVVR